MAYSDEICKKEHPDYKTVFIGPCLSKRVEASKYRDIIDGVITFAELASIFMAKDIDVREMTAEDLGDDASFQDCREYAVTGGVASCVLSRLKDPSSVKIMNIDGIDKKTVRLMGTWQKKAPDADLVEVMVCQGGCIAGPGTIVKPQVALRLRQANKAAAAKKA